MKKLFTLLLALGLILAFAPIASFAEAQDVTIVYYIRGNGVQTDSELINDELNNWLKAKEEYAHINLQIEWYADNASMSTALLLAQASGTQVDMFNTYGLSLATYVNDGFLIDMAELMAATEIPGEIPAWLLALGNFEGAQYLVPNYQLPATTHYIQIPVEYLQYFDGGAEAIRDVWQDESATLTQKFDILKEFVLAVREGTGLQTKWASDNSSWNYMGRNVEQLPGSSNCVELIEGNDGYVNIWGTDWAQEYLVNMAEWYAEGILHPDVATYTASDFANANALKDESFAFSYAQQMWSTPEQLYARDIYAYTLSGIEFVEIPMKSQYYTAGSWAAGGNVITSTCQNPEAAMAIIELLNTKKGIEFYNLLVYGVEGRQWEFNEGNETIRTFEYDGTQGGSSTSYMTPGWMVGNTINQYYNQGWVPGQKEMIEVVGNSELLVHSIVSGLLIDTDTVSNELSQVVAVQTEYQGTLMKGILGADWQAAYDEMMVKMNNAGMDAILEHVNAQVADYMAK